MKPKPHHLRIRSDGVLEWLSPPPVPFKIGRQTKRRFSEIVPSNPFLFVAFRIIRAVFGEGKGRVPEFTRKWPCVWRGTILLESHAGETMTSRNRQAIIDWEHEKFVCKKGLDL